MNKMLVLPTNLSILLELVGNLTGIYTVKNIKLPTKSKGLWKLVGNLLLLYKVKTINLPTLTSIRMF